MKHLGFVGKSTEYLGYTHIEIIKKIEKPIKEQAIELEEFFQDVLIKFINRN